MSDRFSRSYWVVSLWAGLVATMVLGTGAAFAAGLPEALSAPTIEHVDGDRSRELQPEQQEPVEPRALVTGGQSDTELLLVSRLSCSLPFQSAPLSAVPLFGGDQDGQWVLLAGLGWNKDSGFGATGPVQIQTQGGLVPVNWYFTVEMVFVPEGQWHLRASLAIDGEKLHDAVAAPDSRLNPLHVGVAITFDTADKSPLVLNLGYGPSPLKGQLSSVPSDGGQSESVLAETRVFSACLNIQW
jgi:hypothetical protein